MKRIVGLTATVLMLAAFVSACGTPVTGIVARPGNLTGGTANPATVQAVQANVTEQFVAIHVIFGTPTPTGMAVAAAGGGQGDPAQANPTIPPTATRAPATATPAAVAAVSDGPGDPRRGDQIFNRLAGCNACHDVQSGIKIVGPSLVGIASRAVTRKPDTDAASYLRESILAPNAFIVAEYPPNLMPTTFANTLSKQQIEDLVAYLLTFK
jgi:cytochrome c2